MRYSVGRRGQRLVAATVPLNVYRSSVLGERNEPDH
jgi:hypothetical protein